LIKEKEPWRFCANAELYPWFFVCQGELRAGKEQMGLAFLFMVLMLGPKPRVWNFSEAVLTMLKLLHSRSRRWASSTMTTPGDAGGYE